MKSLISALQEQGVDACRRGVLALLMVAILPMNTAVAEPLAGSLSSQAFGSDIAVAASDTPEAEMQNVRMVVPITGYNSEPGQTDSTPCITANGYDLCKANTENVVAANFLDFGTRIQIPDLFGDKVFTVQDRMNSRYDKRLDIWFKDRTSALHFGLQKAEIVILDK